LSPLSLLVLASGICGLAVAGGSPWVSSVASSRSCEFVGTGAQCSLQLAFGVAESRASFLIDSFGAKGGIFWALWLVLILFLMLLLGYAVSLKELSFPVFRFFKKKEQKLEEILLGDGFGPAFGSSSGPLVVHSTA